MTEANGMPRIFKASEMAGASPARWLAKDWLPQAGVSILIGDEGIGKSLFWVRLAAAVTTGKPLHEIGLPARDPQTVVLVITEDDWGSTVLPRLVAAGADLEHIRVVSADTTGSGAPEFPRDLYLIEEMDERPALIVVDTFIDTLGNGASFATSQGAIRALVPMRNLSVKTGAAVLLVTHTNRTKTKNARDKYGSSSEIRKKARMTLFAQRDDDGFLAVGPEKSNLTRSDIKAATFQIKSAELEDFGYDEHGEVVTTGTLFYAGESQYTAKELIARNAENANASVDRQERKDAQLWLHGFLELNGTMESRDIKREANLAGISTRTLQRARNDLKLAVGYVGQPPVSTWSLPPNEGAAEPQQPMLG